MKNKSNNKKNPKRSQWEGTGSRERNTQKLLRLLEKLHKTSK